MDGVMLTSLKQIFHPQGNIFHVMKKSDSGFNEFGEAYFSTINKDEIKGWKKHSKMILNLTVPIGEIKFVVYNEKTKEFFSINLSKDNYYRLTIQPDLWMAFKGLDEDNMLLNIANLEHDSTEATNIELDKIVYEW